MSSTNHPLLVCHSRDLKKEELLQFYKHFNSVVVINEFTSQKKLIEFTKDDVVIVDLRKQKYGRDYLSANIKYVSDIDTTVLIKASGDSFSDKTFHLKHTCKRLDIPIGGYPDRFTFLHFLLQNIETLNVLGFRKKLLKSLFSCCLKSVKN